MAATKRSIDDVADAEKNERLVHRKLESIVETSQPPLQPFVRIAFPHAAPQKVPSFQYPHQLTAFSYTAKHELEFTNSSMRYYCEAPLDADLSYCYESWIKKPESRGRLDGLLRACLRDEAAGERKRASVITWRGVMTKILTSPYEDVNGGVWDLNVMDVDGTLYLEEHTDDAKLAEKEGMIPRRRLQTYYGYAFESYSTAGTPDPKDDPDKLSNGWGGDVNTNVQWCSVVKSKLDDLRMIIGGEVDCVNGRYTGQPDTFVELKTSVAIRKPQDEVFFERKLLKFYFQSFLLGVPEIKVGFRTPQGKITTVQSFKTTHLPRLVRGKPHAWDPNLCLAWAKSFFDFVRESITNHPSSKPSNESPILTSDSQKNSRERRVWRVSFHPGKGVQMVLLDEAGVDEVRNGEERIGILPQWYWDKVASSESK